MTRAPHSVGQGRKPVPTPPSTGKLSRLPPAPMDMPDAGKREYKRVGRHLIERGILSETDIAAFESYCYVIAMIAEFRAGRGDPKTMGTLTQLLTSQRQYANEFGLTPTARTRLGSSTSDTDDVSQLDI